MEDFSKETEEMEDLDHDSVDALRDGHKLARLIINISYLSEKEVSMHCCTACSQRHEMCTVLATVCLSLN